MSSDRYKFLTNLKADACKKGKLKETYVQCTSRQDGSPVPFSKDFTEDDLRRLSEIIEYSNEEGSNASGNGPEPMECSPADITNNSTVPAMALPGDNRIYDPTLAGITPLSPVLVNMNSNHRNESPTIESPNFSPYIALQIAQLGSGDSPAPLTPLMPLLPISPALLTETQPTADIDHENNDSISPKRKRVSSKKRDKGRLRLVHKNQWLDVKRKINKNLGKAYTSRNGKLRKKKEMGPACGDKCKFKCSTKFTDFERDLLFVSFWSMGELVRHWDFINKYCEKISKRRVTTETSSRPEYTIKYYLPTSPNTGENVPPVSPLSPKPKEAKFQVCKTMFLNTFGIKQGLVYSALKKLSLQGTVAQDRRGHHDGHKIVITDNMIVSVCNHVNSFAPVESHYVRERTNKVYLDGSLSYARMFLLYKEWNGSEIQNKARTARQYRDIVNENLNIGFHVPKKDQCDVCHVHKNLPHPLTEQQMLTFTTHIRNKTIARELKNKDKECSISSEDVMTAVYDFQKVHGLPYGETSILYYKRKLNVFNFTIFEMGKKIAKCYVWDESTARRGANEVSSCLYDFIEENHRKGIKVFNFWSDNCGGQNRNRIVFAAYMRAARDFQVTITHKYLEKGHTQNEGDSVHALIERSARCKMVYTPEQWYALIRWAKQDENPYIVMEMTTPKFIDFKTLLPGCNWSVNTNRERVFWSQIKQLEIFPECFDRIQYKIDYCDHEFKCIIVNNALETPKTRARSRARLDNNSPLPAPLLRPLSQAYMGKLPIPNAKIQDLQYLCRNNIIPSIYHDFFMSLIEGDEENEHDREEEEE